MNFIFSKIYLYFLKLQIWKPILIIKLNLLELNFYLIIFNNYQNISNDNTKLNADTLNTLYFFIIDAFFKKVLLVY